MIVEEAENGKERADYGKSLIQELSGILSKEFGNGNSATNFMQMRTFFLSYQKRQILSDESGSRTQKITQIKVNDWMWTYNNYRTPESLDSLPPTIFILKYGKLQPHPAGQTVFPHPHIRTATTIKVKSCFGIELSRGSLQGHWVVINQWWLGRCI